MWEIFQVYENHKLFIWALSSSSSIEKHIPFIRSARTLGVKTVLVSHEPNEELLCADENHVIPLNDGQALRDLANKCSPSLFMTQNCRLTPFLAPLTKDFGVNLYTTKAAQVLAYKDKWHSFIEKMNLPSPKTMLPTRESDFSTSTWGPNPVILKPSFSTGSANIFLFDNIQSLLTSLKNRSLRDENSHQPISLSDIIIKNKVNSEQGGFIIQEYIPFEWQLGVEIFIHNGQVHLIHPAEILINESGYKAYAHLGPIPPPPQLKEIFQNLANLLGLYNCHLSPDILIGKDSKLYILDVNLNVGAEGLLEAIKYRGLDYSYESLKAFCGLNANLDCQPNAAISYASPSFLDTPVIKVAHEDDEDFPQFARKRLSQWRSYSNQSGNKDKRKSL